jgi:hypothetical protein
MGLNMRGIKSSDFWGLVKPFLADFLSFVGEIKKPERNQFSPAESAGWFVCVGWGVSCGGGFCGRNVWKRYITTPLD